jgi:hypothetical protein
MDAQDCGKATRILEWIVFAKRLLKRAELLNSVSLHQGNSQLNEKTRLWEQPIELASLLLNIDQMGPLCSFILQSESKFKTLSAKNYLVDDT